MRCSSQTERLTLEEPDCVLNFRAPLKRLYRVPAWHDFALLNQEVRIVLPTNSSGAAYRVEIVKVSEKQV